MKVFYFCCVILGILIHVVISFGVEDVVLRGRNSGHEVKNKVWETSRPALLNVVIKSGSLSAKLMTNFTNLVVDDNHPPDENGHLVNVGLFVFVINQFSGLLMGETFHFQPWADFQHLQIFMENVQPGRIVICTLRKDLSYEIPTTTRIFLQALGSETIEFLGRGMTWTWATVKGGRTLAEGLTFPKQHRLASRHLISFEVELSEQSEFCPEWPRSSHWQKRRIFCSKYEQYGDLCSCDNPYPLSLASQKIQGSIIEKAAIIMIAYRVPDLYRSLKSLASAAGFDKARMNVYTSDIHPELEEFLELAGITLTVTQQSHEMLSAHIARQLTFALNHTLHSHPDADFIIVLEEDLRFSPDFFIFLNRSATLLKEDPSLYCVSAHNDLSYPNTSSDPKVILRTESYLDYGWMVLPKFAEEMVRIMSPLDTGYDWDVFTYYHIRRGRECIIPEVSRSKHFTRGGTHITQWTSKTLFSSKSMNKDPNVIIDFPFNLMNETYEAYLLSLLDTAHFINASEVTPCQRNFYNLFPVQEKHVLVLFFSADGDINGFRINLHWKVLAECLGTFTLEARESHHGLYRMKYGPAHFILIAYPASPYSYLKPEDVDVFTATLDDQKFVGDLWPKELDYDFDILQQILE